MIDTVYDLTTKPLPVTLEVKAVQQCIDFIDELREHKKTMGVKSNLQFHGNPNSPYAAQLVGALGEAAVCQVFNIPLNFVVLTGRDIGYDIEHLGFRIEVKTINGINLIFRDLSFFLKNADVAIMAQYVGNERNQPDQDPQFVIHGWCSRKDFVTHHQMRDFGYGLNAYVPSHRLRPLSTLAQWAQ